MRNVYVNAGYYNTKALSDGKLSLLESKMQINEDATNYIQVDNNKFEVGVGKRDINNKNNNLINEYLTLYSIFNYCDRIDNVSVLLALPINQYLNSRLKQNYKSNLLGKTLTHTVNDIKKTVLIKKCEVYMEGAAAMLNYNIEGIIGLIDIGGNTINCMIFDNSKLIKDTVIQLDCSMLVLEQQIINTVNIKKGTNYQDYEIKSLFKSTDPEIISIMKNMISDFIEDMIYKLKLKNWNINNIPLFFTGGGSITIQQYLKEKFPLATFSKDAIYDNVKGLEKVGKVIFR